MVPCDRQKEAGKQRRLFCGFSLGQCGPPQSLKAETVALQADRRGVKNPERVVYGVDLANGQVIWEHRFGEEVNFVEKVKGGLLVGCDHGSLSLLDPATGSVVWSWQLGRKGEKVNTFRGEFASGYLVSFHNEVVWFVSPKGELLWSLR